MPEILDKFKKALNVAETASLSDVRAAFDRMLQAEMSPEEKKKREAEQAAMAKDEAAMGEVRGVLGLASTATLSDAAAALKVVGNGKVLSEALASDRAETATLKISVH